MMRILGVVSGAAIAILLLTWLVGVPRFTFDRDGDRDDGIRVMPLPPPVVVSEVAIESAVEPSAEPSADAEASVMLAEDDVPATAVVVPDPADAAAKPTVSESIPDPQWFSFWSPFRSELAANGFVSQLQRVTGLDYRVTRVDTGKYEVAFAYADETEIDLNLSTIAAATGLDLASSR
jgi:hypothetical protein